MYKDQVDGLQELKRILENTDLSFFTSRFHKETVNQDCKSESLRRLDLTEHVEDLQEEIIEMSRIIVLQLEIDRYGSSRYRYRYMFLADISADTDTDIFG